MTDADSSPISNDQNPTLDPKDWDSFRAQGSEILDVLLAYVENVRDRPVWQPVSEDAKRRLTEPAPQEPAELADVWDDVQEIILPFANGNIHPRFFGWVLGTGTPDGVLAEMIAAAMNSNAGGRDHAAVYVERQVIEWSRQIFGMPEGTSGLLLSGTSMAQVIAMAVARDHMAGVDVRRDGVAAAGRLVAYASDEVHVSVPKAAELLGLGTSALRRIEVDSDFRMDVGALAARIREDRAAGYVPFFVVANAGSVNTGSVDDLEAIADLCAAENLWLHVDGAFGSLAVLHPELADRVRGIGRADSVAFDFHKWLHVQYDAGCVLIRDGRMHRDSFTTNQSYLAMGTGGLAGGAPWFCDYGPELARNFRALKVWFTLRRHGLRRLGEMIYKNCRQAQLLAARIAQEPELHSAAPVALNVVCFQYRPTGGDAPDAPVAPVEARGDTQDAQSQALDELNGAIVTRLHEEGLAAPSTTTLNGRLVIRVALTNHRTADSDLEVLVDEVLRIGRSLSAEG
ncbi:MAG: pyridoxal-dependent decarboxylase [Gemmatimonadota bacterium]